MTIKKGTIWTLARNFPSGFAFTPDEAQFRHETFPGRSQLLYLFLFEHHLSFDLHFILFNLGYFIDFGFLSYYIVVFSFYLFICYFKVYRSSSHVKLTAHPFSFYKLIQHLPCESHFVHSLPFLLPLRFLFVWFSNHLNCYSENHRLTQPPIHHEGQLTHCKDSRDIAKFRPQPLGLVRLWGMDRIPHLLALKPYQPLGRIWPD